MRLLIIRPGAIGDTLLTLPILMTFRRLHPDAAITFVGNSRTLPLVQASGLVDEVSNFDSLLWSELFVVASKRTPKFAPLLEKSLQGFDTALCWLRDEDGIVEKNLRDMGISRVIIAPGRPAEEGDLHIVEYLAKTAGISDSMDFRNSYSLEVSRIGMNEPVSRDRYFAIHPGSGGARKCWPVSRFASIVSYLWSSNIPVLLLAGPADGELLTRLLDKVGEPPSSALLTVLVDTPLLDVAVQLQRCRGYLGNDSGITHLAALLGVPTIALFGPSNPTVWHPLGRHIEIIHEPDLMQLRTNTVRSAIGRLLEVGL